ncbi:MAG: hypothetical protein ACLTE2_08150 [Eubacteriales bacterium]
MAKRKVLVQELYSLETLAHVDVLCLDKTGTHYRRQHESRDSLSFKKRRRYCLV